MTQQSRKNLSVELETKVLVKSGRRCCLCVYLDRLSGPHQGQIAHLNQNSSDTRFENLVFLCLDHHDQFDSSTSQSKGMTASEIRHYRNLLYDSISKSHSKAEAYLINESQNNIAINQLDDICAIDEERYGFLNNPWQPIKYPEEVLYLFPFKSPNNADGVCYIERIHLKSGEEVIICSEILGNPGISVTNAIEYIITQVCAHYGLDPNKIICLEHSTHYDKDSDMWRRVRFNSISQEGLFQEPKWEEMNSYKWNQLGLKSIKAENLDYDNPTLVEQISS